MLRRVNYGEADRIITLITPKHGKVSVIAKGVRKSGSKLAGGLELFAVCDLTIMPGKREVGTVTSARLVTFYGDAILRDYERMQLAYECIKLINRATEMVPEPDFYYLLKETLTHLSEMAIDWRITEVWFRLRHASLLGIAPNLATSTDGDGLRSEARYNFAFEAMGMTPHPAGRFGADHIKFLRLATAKSPAVLRQVSGLGVVLEDCLWLTRTLNS